MIKYRNINEFIKVTHHLDNQTLVSKDLELIQVIKIQYDKNLENQVNFKQTVKSSIGELASENLIFYIHNKCFTVPLKPTQYNQEFSNFVNRLWVEENQLEQMSLNELYISVVLRVEDIFVSQFKRFLYGFLTKWIFNKYFVKLEESLHKINTITDKMLEKWKTFGARKLCIVQDSQGYKSELASFYYELINFTKEEYYVQKVDLANQKNLAKLYFGNNVITSLLGNNTFFAVVISIKNILSINDKIIEIILSLKIQLTISEIILPAPLAKKQKLLSQLYYLDLLSNVSKVKNFLQLENLDKYNDKLFQEQVTFTLCAPTYESLTLDMEKLEHVLLKFGITYVVEDVNLEKQFFSYLPSNTSFITRMSLMFRHEVANFAQIRTPMINQDFVSPWGKHIATFKSLTNVHYNFHLHDHQNNNNVLILGASKSGKTTLINFILSQTMHFQPIICYFNLDTDSNVFAKLLGGTCFESHDNLINPFLLESNNDSKLFLVEFFKILLSGSDITLNAKHVSVIENLVNYILDLELNKRTLSDIIAHLQTDNYYSEILQKMSYIISTPQYKTIFSGDNNNLDINKCFNLINLDFKLDIYNTKEELAIKLNHLWAVRAAIIYSYFYFLLRNNQKKQEQIIIIDQIGAVISLPKYGYIIDEIKKSPIALIASVGSSSTLAHATYREPSDTYHSILKQLEQGFGTKLFLFLDAQGPIYKYFRRFIKQILQMTRMHNGDHQIILYQNQQEFIFNFNFIKNNFLINILSASHIEHQILQKTLNKVTNKDDLDELFILFCKNLLSQSDN